MNMGLETLTQEIVEQDCTEMENKYLSFYMDDQLFGIPISDVVQIVGIQPVTEIPEYPHYVKGVVNLRGAVTPLVDARIRLGKPEAEYNERTCIIVTNTEQRDIGFIVDEVDAVTEIRKEQIEPPPKMTEFTDGYIIGVGKLEDKMILLLDTRKTVGISDLNL